MMPGAQEFARPEKRGGSAHSGAGGRDSPGHGRTERDRVEGHCLVSGRWTRVDITNAVWTPRPH